MQLVAGFRNAFLAGAIMCFICLLFSVLAKENHNNAGDQHDIPVIV